MPDEYVQEDRCHFAEQPFENNQLPGQNNYCLNRQTLSDRILSLAVPWKNNTNTEVLSPKSEEANSSLWNSSRFHKIEATNTEEKNKKLLMLLH
ncbi:hypothetical protein [Dubosiella newyorkensis]|uniref:hypothetical protein n=1 Tax=Dubosiella newyorkensis TaxID=1862672 RepID=UPI003D6D28E0